MALKRKEYKIGFSEENIRILSKYLAVKYRELEWKWAGCGIPTAKHIEETFRQLARDAKNGKTIIFTGGLFAEWTPIGLNIGVDNRHSSNVKGGRLIADDEEWEFFSIKIRNKKNYRMIQLRREDIEPVEKRCEGKDG